MSSEEELSDNDNCLRKGVLPVANFDKYDKNVPPKTGEEYLRRVQLEEKNYPEILIKDISSIVKKKNNTMNIQLRCKDFFYLDDERVPNNEWIDNLISEFSNLRLKLIEIKSKNINYFESKYNDYNGKEIIWWREIFESDNKLPLINLVLGYPQNHIKNGFLFITRYLKESKCFTINQGRWIYTLLACLELPIQSEFYYNLRDLSNVCSYIRSKYNLKKSKDLIQSLNIVIYLIGKYYNQYDLIDNYAS